MNKYRRPGEIGVSIIGEMLLKIINYYNRPSLILIEVIYLAVM